MKIVTHSPILRAVLCLAMSCGPLLAGHAAEWAHFDGPVESRNDLSSPLPATAKGRTPPIRDSHHTALGEWRSPPAHTAIDRKPVTQVRDAKWQPASFSTAGWTPCTEESCCELPSPPPLACDEDCSSPLAWKKGDWQITPYGFLAGEVIASDAPVTPRPFVLYVNEDAGSSEQQFTVHGQTTQLGFAILGPYVGSLRSEGQIRFNFLGDRPVLNQSTPFLLRAYGALANEDWRFGFGVGPDIFGARTPEAINFGGPLQSGNIAAFRGQLRVERYIQLTDSTKWTSIAAISQQVVSDFVTDQTAIGTDNGWPNVEGRLLLAHSPVGSDTRFEVGAAGVIGETRAIAIDGSNVSTTWGVSLDGEIDCGRVGARCEAFVGEAIGTYNAAIGQSLNPQDGESIATVGGFGELWYKPIECLAWHVGYGIDNPRNSDLGQIITDPTVGPIGGQRSRNSIYWTNIIWSVTDFFELAFEVSFRETDYIAPSVSNEAMIYHFRSLLSF